jgi:MoaA/NifB/PqqE/SkfB family radical SAM enzyme
MLHLLDQVNQKDFKGSNMKLTLKEIIWEITGKCNNGCSYCGSKDGWNEGIDEYKIRKIADAIAEYPPHELDISGGDPLLISYDTHKYIVEKLKATKCKILINPKSLRDATLDLSILNILELYAHIGISINTLNEMALFKEFLEKHYRVGQFGYTVITNLNLTNFFLFDEFAKFVGENTLWQIQYTMYQPDSLDEPYALYKHPKAIEKLNENMSKYPNHKMIFADNANRGECVAGIHSIGLLSNGDVLPCLSMKSWCGKYEIDRQIASNILSIPLKEIWTHGFIHNRFEDFISCKDFCNRLLLCRKITPVKIDAPLPYSYYVPKYPYPVDAVQAYAVISQPFSIQDMFRTPAPQVTLYAVSTFDSVTSSLPQISSTILQHLKDAQKDKI